METRLALLLLLASLALSHAAPPPIPDRTAAELLPSSTVAYLELQRPRDLIQLLFDSPLRKKVDALPQFRQAVESGGLARIGMVVALVEAKSGLNWRPALETVTGGGIFFAVDAGTGGVALLMKSGDPETLQTLVDAVVDLAEADAERQGNPTPFRIGNYRGITTHGVKEAGFAVAGPWFILVNKKELARTLVDHLLDGGADTLAGNEEFVRLRKTARPGTVWAAAHLDKLREAGVARDLFAGKTPNPAIELLLGGIMESLKHAPHATAELDLGHPAQLDLSISLPHEPGRIPEHRRYFFGPDGTSTAAKPFRPANTLLSMTAYRDVARMWLAADDLFNENMAAKLAKQDSNLGVFFNGKNFGTDILGQIDPHLQLLLTLPDFGDGPVPAIQLPAGALIARIRPPGDLPRQLKVAFQTLIGFLNISGTQEGRPLLELETRKQGDAMIVSATFLTEPGDKNLRQAETFHNFSPAIVQVGDYFILCSSRRLAEQLAAETTDRPPPDNTPDNTQVALDARNVARALNANRGNLIASSQLKKGHSLEEATAEVDSLLSLLDLLKDAGLTLTTDDGTLKLNLTVSFATPN